jgi:hypothetical protein
MMMDSADITLFVVDPFNNQLKHQDQQMRGKTQAITGDGGKGAFATIVR